MSNVPNDDEQNLELIHPEIVDESEPWPPQGPSVGQQGPFAGPRGVFVWQGVWPRPPRREPSEPPKPNWRLHILLFVATCVSTFSVYFVDPTHKTPQLSTMIWYGLCYAVPVMTILLCHEMGHYVQARRYGVYASPPYFIPMPFSPFGTMGAVIVMGSRIKSRRALFDIGISGPLAGLVPTFLFLILGLHYSEFTPIIGNSMRYGEPLLFRFLSTNILGPTPIGHEVWASPMVLAGWVGLLVTSLNLIPIGQLDGGHILYALLRKRAHKIAVFLLFAAFFVTILHLDIYGGWTLLLVLLLFMGPRHPPTADDEEPLGTFRTVLGWLTLAFIFIGFTPTPFVFSS